MRLLTVGLLAAALGLAACAEAATSSAPDFSDNPASTPDAAPSTPDTAPSTPATTEPPVPACAPQAAEVGEIPPPETFEGDPPAELAVEILDAGDEGAATPLPGDCVQVHYIGRLFDTGEVFDSSYPRGQTLAVTVGAGSVIPGFEQGVVQTPLGATTRVTIPPELAYRETGSGPIPPNATLVFDIEVVAIQ